MLHTWKLILWINCISMKKERNHKSPNVDYYLPHSGIQGAMVTFQEQSLTDWLRIGVVLNSPAHKVQKHHWEKKTNLNMAAPGQHKRVLMWDKQWAYSASHHPILLAETVMRLNSPQHSITPWYSQGGVLEPPTILEPCAPSMGDLCKLF